jgi:pimeloyl-ACP methyl ester carboxylesterase
MVRNTVCRVRSTLLEAIDTMPYFDHDELRFHYEERGAGTAFIFQHGLGGDTAQPVGTLAPPTGVRLLAFDCRGHGETPVGDAARLTFETMAGDWVALMDHLGLQAAVAGGISLGAALALHVALQHPARVRAVVLVRPAWLDGALPEANRSLYGVIAGLIREQGLQQAAETFTASPVLTALRTESPAAAEAFLRQFESAQAETAVARLQRLPADVPHPREEWAKLRVPALVVACRDDRLHRFEVAEALAAGLPGARLVEAASRHTDPAHHKQDVQRAVEAFLSEHHLNG